MVVFAGCALGQFETRASAPTASQTFSTAVGDFNRDGKLDIATANNDLQVFLGNGDGTFRAATNYLVNVGSYSVAAVDLNHDGKLDLAVSDQLGLSVLMGNGDGTFQPPITYSTACIPIFVSTGDFNGDHKPDLIVTYSSGNCPYVSIFVGNGDGTFQLTPINTTPLYSPSGIASGDFNKDGKLDVAVAEQFGTISQVEVLLGNGNGTFSAGPIYPVGSSPNSVAVADFRQIGQLDLAVGSLYGGVSVLLGNGDGTFKTAAGIGVSGLDWIISADFNGDGKPDLAVSQIEFPSGISVITGEGDGTFQLPKFYPTGITTRFVASGDFNGDHQTDLIGSADYSGSDQMTVLLNTGVVSFSPTTTINFPFQLVGVISPTQSVSVINTGSKTLSISSIHVDNPFHQTNTCGTSVAPGAKCAIKITFKPPNNGNFAGVLTISDSASSKLQVIPVSGAGTVVRLSPGKLKFPAQKVGTTSAPQQVQVSNTGSAVLTFTTNFYISGNNFRDFSQTNNCGSQLAAGASCTATVTFTPKKTGSRVAYLGMNDDGGGSPQTVSLSGSGD